ncbi:DUF6221 family protein [Streptomyces cyaneofuscatus]|uniref:DUF6221 family protein n=1 Tax=Streptomyces cyaneofuscatus TaxID=66883 RepID=UPI003870C186|nr:DUF6221 family protein [Streptomyces cyaneofuscatus]
MTDALVAFLKARIDDDAAAIPTGLPDWHSPGSRVVLAEGFNEYVVIDESLKDMLERDESLMPFGCVAVTDYDADAKYIARHDPARTLREVEAKRAVLAAYCAAVSAREEAARLVQKARTSGWDPIMAELEEASAIHKRDALHEVLRLLALPYSDHPGYEEALAGG